MAKEIIHTTKQLYIDMGSRLRQERVRLNYTQEQIAEVLNMSTAYYGKIERGVHGLSLQKLLLIKPKTEDRYHIFNYWTRESRLSI